MPIIDPVEAAKMTTIRELRKLADELEVGEAKLNDFSSEHDLRFVKIVKAQVIRWSGSWATIVWREAR